MITEEMKKYWEEKDKDRLASLLADAKAAGIPESEIYQMLENLQPQWDEMSKNLEERGFFDKGFVFPSNSAQNQA